MLSPYEEGRKAYYEGEAIDVNPYLYKSEAASLWKEGYERASTASKDY